MSDDAAVTLAKKILQDADKSPPKGTRPLPFIVRGGGNMPSGSGSLKDIYANNMASIAEMEAARRTDQLARKQLTAWEKTAEAEALRAERDLERLKRGEDGVGSGGPVNQIRDTLQAMTALEQFKGGGGNQQVEQLRLIMENNAKAQEMFSRMMLEMERTRTEMANQLGQVREQSVKAQMEGLIKVMEAKMDHMSKEADFAGRLREVQKLNEMMGHGPIGEAQGRALKQLELETDLRKKQMEMEQKRWEEDKKSSNDILKTVITVLGSAAAPAIAKLADKAISSPALGGGGAAPGVLGGGQQPPKVFSFPKPDAATFNLECGACKNQFGAQTGSDAYLCPKCGAIHKPV